CASHCLIGRDSWHAPLRLLQLRTRMWSKCCTPATTQACKLARLSSNSTLKLVGQSTLMRYLKSYARPVMSPVWLAPSSQRTKEWSSVCAQEVHSTELQFSFWDVNPDNVRRVKSSPE